MHEDDAREHDEQDAVDRRARGLDERGGIVDQRVQQRGQEQEFEDDIPF